MPALAQHMKTMDVDIAIPSTKWFICLYTDVLPTEVSLLVWPTDLMIDWI